MAAAPSAPIQTKGSLTYSGNPDFRGYLAANDPQFLSMIGSGSSGNDYTSFGVNPKAEASFAKANNTSASDVGSAIQSLFDTYQNTPTTSTASTTTSSSGSSNPYYNPAAAALYGNEANQYLSQEATLQSEEPTLVGNIDQAYNTSVSQENQAKGNQDNQNAESRWATNSKIDQNANSAYNSLMSLLGAHGAAGSSAAEYNIPQALGAQTASDTSGMNSTFNQNQNAIDESYQNALQDLLQQKQANTGNALSGLKTQELNDVQQAQADKAMSAEYNDLTPGQAMGTVTPLNQQAQNIQSQLTNIFQQYATPAYSAPAAPSLASYNTPDNSTITTPSASTQTTATSFLPYLTNLNQQQPNTLTGNNATPMNAGGGAGAATAAAAGA